MKQLFSNQRRTVRFLLIAILVGHAQLSNAQKIDKLLESYVESYQNDPMALTVTFGIKIKEDWWHVHVTRQQEAYIYKDKYTFHNFGPHKVELHEGMPEEPTWYFSFADKSVLEKIYDKTWTATTAAMKSFSSDKVALELEEMDGFKETRESAAILYQTMEHFWKKDDVEITSFGRDHSLPTHGAGAVALYTMKDKRVLWFSIMPEATANEDPRLEYGQVPSLFIFTSGKGRAKWGNGDDEFEISAGQSVFVPAYAKNVIFNPNEEPLEGILILFGDNSDYVNGQSYIDFLESQYQFLGENEKTIKN